MVAEDELVCPSCGNLKSVCSDPSVGWYPQRTTCYATAARDLAVRRLQKRFDKPPNAKRSHPLDGVSVFVAEQDLSPDDELFNERSASQANNDGNGDHDEDEH